MITKRNLLFINNYFDTSSTEKNETENYEEVKNYKECLINKIKFTHK